MRIAIAVSEGEQFTVSSVALTGNKIYPLAELMLLVKLKEKQIFNKVTLRSDIAAISDKYSNSGYALIAVIPEVIPDKETRLVKVVYKINEGDKFRIGKIDISGNTKTKDKVIRREVRVDEGVDFNSAALKRSQERLKNLNFFETVDIVQKPKAAEKIVDLDIKIKEKQTGAFTIGGGYSSDGPIANAEISQSNLLGTGVYVSGGGSIGTKVRDASLKYRDPWFMDKPISFGATVYTNERFYPAFKRKAVGGELSFGRNFWEYWSAGLAYNLESAKIYDVTDNQSVVLRDQIGTRITSSITPGLARDTRDNFLDPTRGNRNSINTTFAGLGGDNKWVRVIGDSSWYFPIFWDSTVHLRGRAGWISGVLGKSVPLYERFYLGGIDTLRGFGLGVPGPKDHDSGQAIGGTKELIINAEYIFPIVKDLKLKGVAFYDAGKAYDNRETFGSDIRSTAGGGVRWISPFGPIRVEYGVNIFRRHDEGFGRVEFGFGSAF
jgi:outer membrane protein insertion porin family